MLLETIVGPRLDGDTDAFCCAPLRVADRFGHAATRRSAQRVVQIAYYKCVCFYHFFAGVKIEKNSCFATITNEKVAIFLGQAHERAAHDDELDLVDAVAELLELLEAMLGLQVGIVARSYGAHRRRLVASVRLRRVLEVAVRTARAVDANVARHCDVRTPMRLAHDCHHGYLSYTLRCVSHVNRMKEEGVE